MLTKLNKCFLKAICLVTTCLTFLASDCSFGFQQDIGKKPLKVFILAGQSNMQGHAKVETIPHIAMDSRTNSIHRKLVEQDGAPKVFDNVWISYLSSGGVKSGKLTTGFGAGDEKIGPELTFGIYMQEKLNEPILIIKTAWGGKSINTDFRPPSAGLYAFQEDSRKQLIKQGKDFVALEKQRNQKAGVYYRKMIDHVRSVLKDIPKVVPGYDENQGYELAGFVWFQGWNDMVDRTTYPNRGKAGGYDQYSKVLSCFIRDVRKDLNCPTLPFVVGVMGVNGPTAKYSKSQLRYQKVHQNFRDAMAAPAKSKEFGPTVKAVFTEKYWDHQLDELIRRNSRIRQKVQNAKKEGNWQPIIKALSNDRSISKVDLNRIKQLKKHRQIENEILKALQKMEFSSKELTILKTGKSNAGYHYLGSGKILAQIGIAFADAIPVKK